ncbi:MAG: Gfo/Idh/MocA family oxidoreductase, partial [Myxococcota bacterium]
LQRCSSRAKQEVSRMRIETAALVGAGWGRVHIGALRAAQVEVVQLIGRDLQRTEQAAREEGIKRASTELREIEADLVVLASPTPVHAEHLRALAGRVVLMEKPVVGPNLPEGALRTLPELCFVNYAFPFVEVVQAADAVLDRAKSIVAVEVEVRLELPSTKSVDDWLLDVAAHPLAWVEHRVGPLRQVSRSAGGAGARFELQGHQGVPVHLRFALGGATGIAYRLRWWCERTGGGPSPIEVHGTLLLGEPWTFGGAGFEPPPPPAADPWIVANYRSVAANVSALRSGGPVHRVRDRGLFDLERGLFAERALLGEDYVRALRCEP